MLTEIEFENFRCFKQMRATLSPFTVFVGANGSGKSTILEGMNLLGRASASTVDSLLSGKSEPYFLVRKSSPGPMRMWQFGSERDDRLKIDPKDIGNVNQSRLNFDSAARKRLNWPIRKEFREGDLGSDRDGIPWQADALARRPSSAYLRLSVSKLAAANYCDAVVPEMESDGTGMSSVLAYLVLNQPQRFRQLMEHFRQVIPAVADLRFGREEIERIETERVTIGKDSISRQVTRKFIGDALIFDMVGAPALPAHAVSEGTLLTLAILTFLCAGDGPRVILIDDLDQGLHPKAQRELVAAIRSVQAELPDVQVVATTHSPYLLDSLRPEEVRCVAMRDDGSSVVAPLADHPEFDRWKDEMLPGELWSMFGEKWVTEQGPAPAGEPHA